jgi:nucleoside-diphosphate-sugar epimerase
METRTIAHPATHSILTPDEPILVTGSNSFIGAKVVDTLLERGCRELRCFVRPCNRSRVASIVAKYPNANVQFIEGNLSSRPDCQRACVDVALVFHLAAGIEKSFAGSYLNSVVTTLNLLDAVAQAHAFRRFVLVSSFAVYSNWNLPRNGVLDESCPVEVDPMQRHEPYCYAKAKQEEILREYSQKLCIPYVIVRPGAVYGPGARQYLSPRIGIDTFGLYLHLGGRNRVPLTYIDNCAEAIVLAGITPGVDGEVFNVVDDELHRSQWFLKHYKRNVAPFRSLSVPYPLFYLFSLAWEKYATWSNGQLPPVFNRRRTAAYWRGNRYSNEKAKRLLGWCPRVSSAEGARKHFEYFKNHSQKSKI